MAGLAEHYRRHREAFSLALKLGCTPREAENELRRREAAERNKQAQERLAAKMAGNSGGLREDTATGTPQQWWMRD